MQYASAEPSKENFRSQLEGIARALGLEVGETELHLRFKDGHLRWWNAGRIRVAATELEGQPREI